MILYSYLTSQASQVSLFLLAPLTQVNSCPQNNPIWRFITVFTILQSNNQFSCDYPQLNNELRVQTQ